jgi:hypothetical protein
MVWRFPDQVSNLVESNGADFGFKGSERRSEIHGSSVPGYVRLAITTDLHTSAENRLVNSVRRTLATGYKNLHVVRR